MSFANVSRFLHDHLGPRPDAEALVFGDRRYTFAELERAVDRAAHALKGLGAERGERVMLLARSSDHLVIAMLALAKLGAIAVPLNFRWAAPEIAYAIDQCEPALMVLDEANAELAQQAIAEAQTTPPTILIDGADDSLAARAAAVDAPPLPYADVSLDDTLRILYTSGTTSRPKGVMTTHGNSAWNHRAMAFDSDLYPGDRVLVMYPLFHVSGLECPGIFTTLSIGATVVLLDGGDAELTKRTLIEERITGCVLLPPLYGEVLHALDAADVPDLRWILTGAVTPATTEEFVRKLPNSHIIEVYAMTETTGATTILDRHHMVEKAGRTGRAVRNVDIKIVDDDGNPVPVGTTGRILVRGPKVSPGYWRDPSPEPRPDGWFDTGDLGDLDEDGYLAFRGRAKEMIKTGGENVAMAEIERVLHMHPAVKAACIVKIPHERWGESPKAFILLEEGAHATAEELEAHCRASLAGYKVPREWEFADSLPFNHSGKVLRRELQAMEDARRAAVAAR